MTHPRAVPSSARASLAVSSIPPDVTATLIPRFPYPARTCAEWWQPITDNTLDTLIRRVGDVRHSTDPRVSPAQDALCDLLADGFTIRQCAERLGKSPIYVNALLQRIRRKLGAQAI